MACRLTLTAQQARSVIEASEGREPGPGHTKARHVTITKADLIARAENQDVSGDILFFGAFVDIHDCAEALSLVVDALDAHPFVANFCNQDDGDRLTEFRVLVRREFKVRYSGGGGIMPGQHFSIVAQKMALRPHQLHLITFYPTIGIR